MIRYLSNASLPTILSEKDWVGTPVNEEGSFFNPDYPFELGWKDVLKWQLSPNPYKEKKQAEGWRHSVVKEDDFLRHDRDCVVWLGHASFYLRLNGLNMLIDPVFGKLSPFTPRFSEMPVSPDKFRGVDLVLVTHDHRDHCDKDSLKLILKNNAHVKILTGLNMNPLLAPWSEGHEIIELGWYQVFEDEKAGLKVFFLPTRHWSRRWLTDTNKRLWGAFVLQTSSVTIYMGSDSGFGKHYCETAELFPQIDFAFLGIGAFAPEWFMYPNHMSPADAWQAFKDLGAKKFVPMHYGTFDLSDEPLGEPERLLRDIAQEKKQANKVVFLPVGQTREIQHLILTR